MSVEYVATCAEGLEQLLADEMRSHGAEVHQIKRGSVEANAPLEAAYRLCMWSRVASRVLIPLFWADRPEWEDLAAWAASLEWEEHFSETATIAVRAYVDHAVSWPAQLAALKLKDGVVDRFRERCGIRPNVKPDQPDVPLYLHVTEQHIFAGIDISGESLHRRTMRTHVTQAPLKETLAAAMLQWSGWPGDYEVLVDPMCGSGTLLLEAALMAADVAPGLDRRYYGFLKWNQHEPEVWAKLCEEARLRAEAGRKKRIPTLIGFDSDVAALRATEHNLSVLNPETHTILLERRVLAKFQLPEIAKGKKGLLVCNPPYGERLSDADSSRYLYRALGRTANRHLPGWTATIISPDITHLDSMGLEHLRTERFNNGGITCYLRAGLCHAKQEEQLAVAPVQVDLATLPAPDFANRVLKNFQKVRKLESYRTTGAARIFDADMPEYNLRAEIHDGRLWVNEFPIPTTIDRKQAEKRFSVALATLRAVFGLERDRVSVCRAPRLDKKEVRPELHELDWQGSRLLLDYSRNGVNGLDLEKHKLWSLIQQERPQSFLHCWAGSGTLEVLLKQAGFPHLVSMEERSHYAQWMRRQWALNGWPDTELDLHVGNIQKKLATLNERFDTILVTPAESHFAQQKRQGYRWKEHHVDFLFDAMRYLADNGTLWFCIEEKGFQIDPTMEKEFDIVDMSRSLLPEDCERSSGRLKFYALRHR